MSSSPAQEQHRLESIPLENADASDKPASNADKALFCIFDGLSSIIGMIIIIGLGLHMIVTGWLFRNNCRPGVVLPIGIMALGAALLVLSTYFPLYRRAFQKAKAIVTHGSAPLTLELVHKNFPCHLNKLYNNIWLVVGAAHSFVGFRMCKRIMDYDDMPCAPALYWTAYVIFLIYVVVIVFILLACVFFCFGRCCCPKKIRQCCGGSEPREEV